MGFKFVLLWTDVALYALVAALAFYVWRIRHQPNAKANWLKVLRDPAARGCAAFWPESAGWHRVQSGDREQAFFVRAHDAAPGMRAQSMREATLRLASSSSEVANDQGPGPDRPGARWPWWLGWLVASAALWWFERSRVGRRLSAA